MKVGKDVYTRLHCLSYEIAPFNLESEIYGVKAIDDEPYLRYRLQGGDEALSWVEIFWKLQFYCTAVSIASFGHFWTDRRLVDNQLNVIWEQPKIVPLVVDKEVDKEGPTALAIGHWMLAYEMAYWVAVTYPRVFWYHRLALFLLRSNFPGEYLYPEVLLDFYKVVELVTKSRTGKKPVLKHVLAVCRDLDITGYSEQEIKEFCTVRGRDAAHDWGKAKPIPRELVVDCKLLAEQMVIWDMLDRFPHARSTITVKRSPTGGIKAIYRM